MAQEVNDEAFENNEQEGNYDIDKNTFGLSLVNGAFGVDLKINGDYFAPVKLTYANQIFYERELGNGFSVVGDVLYFIDDIPPFSNKGAIHGKFTGTQFEIGFAKEFVRNERFNSQFELAYLFGNQTYEGTYFNVNEEIESFEYKVNGPKLAHKFSYKLNDLFGIFFKSSIQYLNLEFREFESSELIFLPIDALGFNKSF